MGFDMSFFLPLDHLCATRHSFILKWERTGDNWTGGEPDPIKSTNAPTVHIWFIESLYLFISFSFFQVLNSCYSANLVCSIGIVAIVLWFQPLYCCCFLFLFFPAAFFSFLFFFSLFFWVISSCPLFYFISFIYIYIKLLVNTINCHNIFTIVDMLIPHSLK